MNSYWINALDDKEKERVDKLEMFDEEEEIKIKCAHYFLATSFKDSTNSNYFDSIYLNLKPVFDYSSNPKIEQSLCKWNDVSSLTSGKKTSSMRWGHSANLLNNNNIIIFGGYGGSKSHARLNDVLLVNPNTLEMTEPFVSGVPPSPRMFHTSSLYKESIYIVGGRESPTNALNQVYQLSCGDQYSWKQIETQGSFPARWRHSASVINNSIYIFGGRSQDNVFNDCFKLNLETMEWTKVETSGNIPSPRYSHTSNVINSTQLLIFGGISNSSTLYNDVYVLDTLTNVWSKIETKGVEISKRFSHSATNVGENIYVIGGCSPAALNDIYVLNTSNWTWSTVLLSNTNAILSKHTCILYNDSLLLLGGGALCFSFGTFFNSLEVLSLNGSNFTVSPASTSDLNNNNNIKSDVNNNNTTTTDSGAKTTTKKPKKSKKVSEIPRIENPTVEEFLNISQNLRKPVIITNSNMGQCTKLWTPEYLSQLLKGKEIAIHISPHKNLDFLNKNYKFQNMDFEQVFAKLYDPSFTDKIYVRSSGANVRKDVSDIWETYPELTKDFQVPEFCPMAQRSSSQYFSSVFRVSSKETTMWTHYDVMDNILCEISGTKLVTLWEPSEVRHLYANGSTSRVLDVDSPDYRAFPKFAKAKSMQGLLKAGEILYIPAFTFHHVSMLDPCVSINIFWKDLPNEYYEKKDLYGNKDLLLGTKAVKEAETVVQTLQQLPEYYREFYVRRILENIKTSFNL